MVFALPDPEDKDTIILRNAENYSPNNTAAQSCRLEYILYEILVGHVWDVTVCSLTGADV